MRLFVNVYKPPLQNNQYFVSNLSDLLDFNSNKYVNKVVLRDFNLETLSPSMLSFNDSQNCATLVKNKTCFKGTGSCIDLILTNRKYSFKNTSYETGLSDRHHLLYSVIETTFNCEESKKSIYRTYSNFSQKDFQGDLSLNIGDGKNDYLEFEKNFVETLDKHALKIIKTFNSYFQSVTDSLEQFDWPLQSNIFYDKVQNIIKSFLIILVLLKSSTNST